MFCLTFYGNLIVILFIIQTSTEYESVHICFSNTLNNWNPNKGNTKCKKDLIL